MHSFLLWHRVSAASWLRASVFVLCEVIKKKKEIGVNNQSCKMNLFRGNITMPCDICIKSSVKLKSDWLQLFRFTVRKYRIILLSKVGFSSNQPWSMPNQATISPCNWCIRSLTQRKCLNINIQEYLHIQRKDLSFFHRIFMLFIIHTIRYANAIDAVRLHPGTFDFVNNIFWHLHRIHIKFELLGNEWILCH